MQLVKNEDGTVINVIEAHKVTREELVSIVEKAEAYVKESKENLAKFDELSKPEADTPAEKAEEIAEDAAELAEELKPEQPAIPTQPPVEGQPVAVEAAPAPVPQPPVVDDTAPVIQ